MAFILMFAVLSAHASMDVKTAISKLEDKSDVKILEIANKATLRIDTYNPSTGAGGGGTAFFINPDGYIVTNDHIAYFMLSKKMKPVFTLYDGSIINGDFKVIRCSDDRKIDLCILKLNTKPEYYFNIVPVQEKKKEKVFVLGKTSWKPVVFDTGTICCTLNNADKVLVNHDENHGVKMVHFIARKAGRGFSGGPVFNSNGDLIAVLTLMFGDLNKPTSNRLGISSSEVYKYMTTENIKGVKLGNKQFSTDDKLFQTDSLKKICKYAKSGDISLDVCNSGIKAACADKTRTADCAAIKTYNEELKTSVTK